MIGFAVSTTGTSIGTIGFAVSTISTTGTLIGMIDFVASIVSTKSLFSITSVFRSITHLPTTRIPTTHTDTADTVIRAAMAMDPRLCSCSAGWLGRATTMVLLMESWDRGNATSDSRLRTQPQSARVWDDRSLLVSGDNRKSVDSALHCRSFG